MLDAFIIEKIRREREQPATGQPLRIGVPHPDLEELPGGPPPQESDQAPQRGVVEIDIDCDLGSLDILVIDHS
jgi:hypothetical protein